MNNREFFNSLAFKWDQISKHDHKKIQKIIELSEIKKNAKILDVGTGTGILISFLLEKMPSKVTAIDISENMIEEAKKKYSDPRIEFVAKDVMEYDKTGYDYIFIYSAYPHFKDKAGLLKHLCTLLNNGGKIIIAHSQSRDEINHVHANCDAVKNDVLPPACETINLMKGLFTVDKSIDNEEMYYISAHKYAYR